MTALWLVALMRGPAFIAYEKNIGREVLPVQRPVAGSMAKPNMLLSLRRRSPLLSRVMVAPDAYARDNIGPASSRAKLAVTSSLPSRQGQANTVSLFSLRPIAPPIEAAKAVARRANTRALP
jgi:hypothetical protein